MAVYEIKHPLIKHKIGLMRKDGISTKHFRELCSEIGTLLTYEATRQLDTEKVTIQGWSGSDLEVEHIKGKKITVVPILRAGLGMLDGVLQLIPNAKVSVVGLYRNEETLEPVPYFEKIVAVIDRFCVVFLRSHACNRRHPGRYDRYAEGRWLQTYHGIVPGSMP